MIKFKSLLGMYLFIIFLSSYRLCFADGVFIPTVVRKFPDIPVQRTLVKYRDGVETLIIEAALDGKGESFGWIIPVPNVPKKLEKISPGLLKTLSLQLEPEIIYKRPKHWKYYFLFFVPIFVICFLFILKGWRGGLVGLIFTFVLALIYAILLPQFMEFRAGPEKSFGIKLVSSQRIGDYKTFVIQAKESDDLNDWLAGNGFVTFSEKALPIIEDYIHKGWCFFAAKLIRKKEGRSSPHPILMEFETERPVYPMRLTSLPGSPLYLELFVLAEKEAVPINYDLRKEYCNYFDLRDILSVIPEDYLLTRNKFVGRIALGNREFWWSRSPLGDHDEIGHPDATRLFWDGCVLTKYVGEISSSQIKEDMIFKFENVEPFRYSMQVSGEQSGFNSMAIALCTVFIIGLPILAITYRISLFKSRLRERKGSLLAILFSLLIAVCIIRLLSYYLQEKHKSKQIKERALVKFEMLGRPRSEWANFKNYAHFLFSDLDRINSEEFTDLKLMRLIKDEHSFWNPFTKEAVLIEDSPGNITVVRKHGFITGINLYWRDGTPYFMKLYGYLNNLKIAHLIQESKDEDPELRMLAALELGERKNLRAVEPLNTLLKDEDKNVRSSAMIALGKITKHSSMIEPLIAALKDNNKSIRLCAMSALGEIKDTQAVEPLLEMIQKGDRFGDTPTCKAALKAIAQINDPRTLEPLIAILRNAILRKNAYVQGYVLKVMKIISGQNFGQDPDQWQDWWEHNRENLLRNRDRKAQLKLNWRDDTRPLPTYGRKFNVKILISGLEHKDWKVRREAARQLGQIWDPIVLKPALEPLLTALGDEKGDIRWSSAGALGNTRDPRAVEPLISLLQDKDDNARSAAAKALGKIRDARAVKGLIAALEDEKLFVRNAAVEALGEIKDSQGIDAIVALLDGRDWVRRKVATVVGKIKEPRAVKHLIPLLRDMDSVLRREAAWALENITGQNFGKDHDQWQDWWKNNKDDFL
ncbi:MAG: DUF2330 domain-containing protein [bacterium]